MPDLVMAVSQTRLRDSGRQLSRLAAACEVLLVLALMAVVAALWRMSSEAQAGLDFARFVRGLFTAPVAASNLHDLAQAACLLLLLDQLRRWGHRLSSVDPVSPATLASMAKLKWWVLLLAAVSAFSFDLAPTGVIPADPRAAAWTETLRTTWDFSPMPLLGGIVLALSLVVAERIAADARMLRAENEQFV